MSVRSNLRLFLVVVLITSFACVSQAQLSEMKVTHFVSPDTIFAMSFNIDACREHVDEDDDAVEEFYEVMDEESGFDFASLESIIIAFGMIDPDTDEEFVDPGQAIAMHLRFSKAIDQEAVMESMYGDFFEFEEVEHGDYVIHVVNDEEGFGGSMPGFFFPDENTLIVSPQDRLELLIDNESQQSDGMMLINQLDLEKEFSAIFECGEDEDETRESVMEMFRDMYIFPEEIIDTVFAKMKRVEVMVDLEADPAATASIEMDDADSAEELAEYINSGVQALPMLLDMAEEEVEDDEFMGEVAVESLDITRTALEKFEIGQNGNSLHLKIAGFEEAKNIPKLIASAMVAQFQMFQEWEDTGPMIDDFDAIELEVDDDGDENDAQSDDGI